jgi:hypothetical protein
MDIVCWPSLDSVEAGAPEAEIEITPEMIEGGGPRALGEWGH